MSGEPKRYSPEFKEQAAKKVIDNSLPIAAVAREIGVNDTTLGFWVKAYRKKRTTEELPLDMPDRAQLRELERRSRVLREGASVTDKYEFIDAKCAGLSAENADDAPPITCMCEWLGVSKSGF